MIPHLVLYVKSFEDVVLFGGGWNNLRRRLTMLKSKPRRWNIMPTYHSLTIPEIERTSEIDEEREGRVIGEFRVTLKPSNFIRRRLTICNHEISQYFFGGIGKFKLTIEHKGSNKPFNYRLQRTIPTQEIVCLEINVESSVYTREIEIPFFECSGQYRYFIEVYSQLEWEESKKEIMFLEVLSFDKVVTYILAAIFTGGFGSLLTWLFMR